MIFRNRLKRLSTELQWLRPLAGSLPGALWLVLRRKQNQSRVLSVQFHGKPVYFRGIDSNALYEVLHEKEYGFLDGSVEATSSPTIIDVGAHIGTFAIWALDRNPAAEILSVEADPATYRVLQKNNRPSRGNWEILNKAASNVDGAKVRFSNDGPSMSHRISPNGALEIETISLEALINRMPSKRYIDILKVDIEGAEEQFLCAAPHMLSRVRCLIVELHPELCNTDAVRQALAANFSSIQEIAGRKSNKPLLYCVRSENREPL